MPSKTQSILIAGVSMAVVAALVGFFPVVGGCLTCVAVLAAGLIAVWHYTDTYNLTITGGTGAGMGAAAGAVMTVVGILLGLVLAVLGLQPGFGEGRRQALQGLEDSGLDPEQLDQFSGIIESAAFPLVIVACTLVVYLILGAIGGAIGAAVFKKGGDAPSATTAAPPAEPAV